MKKVIFATVAAAILITGSVFVIAQKSMKKDGHGFDASPGPIGHGGFRMALRGLDLTDEQKEKEKKIKGIARTAIEPFMHQARENHEKIRSLGQDGKFDQAQVEAIAAEQGSVTAKIIVEKEKTKAAVFAILTDEQKAKAETMLTKFEERFKGGKARHEKPSGSEF